MSTHITRSNQRLKLLTAEESHKAGNFDAESLLARLRNVSEDDDPACLMADAMNSFMALAFENRIEESIERLDGFCAVIGPVLERASALEAKCILLASLNQADRKAQASERVIRAASATCSHLAASRIITACPDDDEALMKLCELQISVCELEALNKGKGSG
ncbi:hypothetical protein [Azovibrio restrictus]|uniref:hypothetical protein n=1 Tax=Azovibrio restrictus TaxID=146938 RepID=UPI0026EA190D|nr:hypothetical protein [Azovibrio restrictus]MDD3481831.1 hypothetical protein [Azovibrio restrictus]